MASARMAAVTNKIYVIAAAWLTFPGCFAGGPQAVLGPQPMVPPDLAAIAIVVSTAYRTEWFGRQVLFVDTSDACDTIMPRCTASGNGLDPALKRLLQSELQAKIQPQTAACYAESSLPALTPVHCETGEVGVVVSLGRFVVDGQGRLHIAVTIARSGLDGVVLEYILEASDGGWTIVDTIIQAIA